MSSALPSALAAMADAAPQEAAWVAGTKVRPPARPQPLLGAPHFEAGAHLCSSPGLATPLVASPHRPHPPLYQVWVESADPNEVWELGEVVSPAPGEAV